MEIFDNQHRRRPLREALQQRQKCLKEPGLRRGTDGEGRLGRLVGMFRRPEFWQHPRKHCALGADKVDQCRWRETSAETAQSLDQRPVRYRSFAEFDAPAEEYASAVLLGLIGEPRHQPGLAHASLPADAEGDRIARPRGIEGGVQSVELSCTADKMRGCDGPRHGDEYRSYSIRLETGSRWLITPLLARKAGWRWGWPAN